MKTEMYLKYMAQLATAAGTSGETVEVEVGADLASILDLVSGRYEPTFRQLLFDGDRLRTNVIYGVDGEQIDPAGDWRVDEKTREVFILTPMAGG